MAISTLTLYEYRSVLQGKKMLEKFIELWTHPESTPVKITRTALDKTQVELSFQFPEDYRIAVLALGLPHATLDLLHSIAEQNIDLDVVGDFYMPEEIVSETLDWREMGMPEDLIAFASDVMGNMFCFRATADGPSSGTVWFFDHDFDEVSEVAPSFTAWIQAYCEVPRIPAL